MYVNNLVVVLCCVVGTVGLTEGRLRRTRRGACKHGTYQHEGNTCCYCSIGNRVLNHCTDTSETQCERCEDHTFIEYNNNALNCHSCKVCDFKANMDTKVRCSPFSDTVCGCKESNYCEKGDLCKACYPCETCEKNGVKQQCTESNNTVCNANAPVNLQSTNTGTIVAVLMLLILLAGVGVVVFYLWRKHQLCFKNEQSKDAMNREEHIHLNDLDLNPHLPEIADVLGWKTMKRVAQWSGMSKTDIEEQECNHRNDVKEQTYALLQAWHQRQGLHGAYQALINTLHRMKERRTADEIQNIIEPIALVCEVKMHNIKL